MTFIVFIGIILVYLIISTNKATKECEQNEKIKKEDYKKEGLEYIDLYSFKCLGGFKDMGACESCYINLFKDRVKIQLFKQDKIGNILGSKEAEIMLTDIVDLALQSESQLIEKVSLKKMVVFGLLSLGMKGKKEEITRELLVLTIKYENDIINLVLLDKTKDSNSTFKFLKEINSLKVLR